MKNPVRENMFKHRAFLDWVEVKPSGCWEWVGSIGTRDGYGTVKRDGKRWLAHRYAWTQAMGPIPEGGIIMHTCDNPPCVNVGHLRLGTLSDNAKDRHAKGRCGSYCRVCHA